MREAWAAAIASSRPEGKSRARIQARISAEARPRSSAPSKREAIRPRRSSRALSKAPVVIAYQGGTGRPRASSRARLAALPPSGASGGASAPEALGNQISKTLSPFSQSRSEADLIPAGGMASPWDLQGAGSLFPPGLPLNSVVKEPHSPSASRHSPLRRGPFIAFAPHSPPLDSHSPPLTEPLMAFTTHSPRQTSRSLPWTGHEHHDRFHSPVSASTTPGGRGVPRASNHPRRGERNVRSPPRHAHCREQSIPLRRRPSTDGEQVIPHSAIPFPLVKIVQSPGNRPETTPGIFSLEGLDKPLSASSLYVHCIRRPDFFSRKPLRGMDRAP